MAATNGAGRTRRFWFDPRFAIGVVLVAASVIGTVLVVGAADATTEVFTARSALTPGQSVSAGDLAISSVAIDDVALYLSPADLGADSVIVSRTIAAGELVPASAVGAAAGEAQTTVVVDLASRLAESFREGGTGDLWATAKTSEGYGAPTVIVAGATLVRIVEPEGLVVDQAAASVELLVPRESTAKLLEAMANGAVLEFLPTSLPAKD